MCAKLTRKPHITFTYPHLNCRQKHQREALYTQIQHVDVAAQRSRLDYH